MTIPVFFKIVEIQTKLASFFPFVIGVLFSLFYFRSFHLWETCVFFLAMSIFDMTTTAINNFMDFKKAKDDKYKYQVNIIGQSGISERFVRNMIFGMLLTSALLGLYLVYKTGWLLLFMGGICCFIGIFYTFGPIPLSRMPLGEIFSGVTMGLGIFMITIYINCYQTDFLLFSIKNGEFLLGGNIKDVLAIGWASLPMVFTIANIMLANNLCDLDEDIQNHRYTLPFYIGKRSGILLFDLLMYACYVTIVIGICFKVYHWSMLVVFFTLPLIHKNVKAFNQEQIKTKTFVVSIKNLITFNTAQVIGLLLSLIFTK